MTINTVNPDKKNIEDIRLIFERNGFARTTIYNEHIYRDRLGQKPICSLYYADNKLGALYAVVPAKFLIHGHVVDCYQSLDTMVDADCRGKGLFQNTAQHVYSRLEDGHDCLVYGFPNGNSYTGFKKYLDWNFMDPVPFLIRPIRLSYFLKNSALKRLLSWVRLPVFGGSAKGIHYEESFPEDPDLQTLCDKFTTTYRVGVQRSLAYLKDRYASPPERHYRYVTYRNPLDGKIEGMGIYCIEQKHGGKMGYVMDLIYLPEKRSVASRLLAAIVLEMSRCQCDCVLAWCFSHSTSYPAYLKCLFLVLPEKLRPIELHIGYRCVGKLDATQITDKKAWYISYSDSDTV